MAGQAQTARTHQAPAPGKQLAQVRPAVTSAVAAYTCPATAIVEISLIMICNPAGTSQLANLYHDDDGTTYGTTTALIDGKVIAADDYIQISFARGSGIWMNKGGSIGFKTDLADSMTITLYGVVYEIN